MAEENNTGENAKKDPWHFEDNNTSEQNSVADSSVDNSSKLTENSADNLQKSDHNLINNYQPEINLNNSSLEEKNQNASTENSAEVNPENLNQENEPTLQVNLAANKENNTNILNNNIADNIEINSSVNNLVSENNQTIDSVTSNVETNNAENQFINTSENESAINIPINDNINNLEANTVNIEQNSINSEVNTSENNINSNNTLQNNSQKQDIDSNQSIVDNSAQNNSNVTESNKEEEKEEFYLPNIEPSDDFKNSGLIEPVELFKNDVPTISLNSLGPENTNKNQEINENNNLKIENKPSVEVNENNIEQKQEKQVQSVESEEQQAEQNQSVNLLVESTLQIEQNKFTEVEKDQSIKPSTESVVQVESTESIESVESAEQIKPVETAVEQNDESIQSEATSNYADQQVKEDLTQNTVSLEKEEDINKNQEQEQESSSEKSTDEHLANLEISQMYKPSQEFFSHESSLERRKKSIKVFFVSLFNFFAGLFLDIFIVLGIVVFLRIFIVSPFQVKGHSMQDTLQENDFILVDQITYRFKNPMRGDVIVFNPPSERLYEQKGVLCSFNKIKAKIMGLSIEKACLMPEFFVKRIIGIPGDTVEIQSGKVYITPQGGSRRIEITEGYLIEENQGKTCLTENDSCATTLDVKGNKFIVPENSLFVLGDNRKGSNDSRHWKKDGQEDPFVPLKNVRGKARVILWPITSAKILSETTVVGDNL